MNSYQVPDSLVELIDIALETQRTRSTRRLTALANQAGYHVAASVLDAIYVGTYPLEPTPDTLQAIAWLAETSDEVAFGAAQTSPPQPDFDPDCFSAENCTLAEIILLIRHRRTGSAAALSELATANGYPISKSALSTHSQPDSRVVPRKNVIRALAWLAGLDEEAVAAAAERNEYNRRRARWT